MKKIFIFIAKLIIAIGLLGYLFSKIDWDLFLNILKNANIILIIIFSLMSYLGVYISILRWDIFLKSYGLKINKLKLYSLYSIGTFFNNFLPTTIGGDVYKFSNLSRGLGDKKTEIISSMILERGSGFLTLFLINIILAPFFYKLIISSRVFLLLEIAVFIAFALILFFIKKYQFLLNIELNIEKLTKREIPLINKFSKLIISLSGVKDKKPLVYGIVYSFLFFLGTAVAQSWILFHALGVGMSPFYISLISPLILIFGMIPISLNSIGIIEGLVVFFYHLIGVPIEISLAFALIGRVSLTITSSLGGIFYFIDKRISCNVNGV